MSKKHRFDANIFRVKPGSKFELAKVSTSAGKELNDKVAGKEALAADVSALQQAQEVLYASNSRSLLIIFQGMDAAGKDGTIRHVMSGINPQGCRVYAFKAPNSVEVEHHFLWRAIPCLPERGMISLFNRSYYEEVLVVRVHPNFLKPQNIPDVDLEKPKSLQKLWKRRYKEIKSFEKTLVANGTLVLKFFLNVSRDAQRERFLERLENKEKHWKFNAGDLAERKLWPEYQVAIDEMLQETSTDEAPWHVIPCDDKWYARAAVADIIAAKLEELGLQYPTVPAEELATFETLAAELRAEPSGSKEPSSAKVKNK